MDQKLTFFVGTFTTLLAVINPLEVLPIYLKLLMGQDEQVHRAVAIKSCVYAAILLFFFLIFGNLMLRIFSVPLAVVRIVGGIVLVKIGFQLFLPSLSGSVFSSTDRHQGALNVAFVPLAMPLMFGPGAIAIILGLSSFLKGSGFHIASLAAISVAILAAMTATCLIMLFAKGILMRIGANGVDAATRIVGFFVSAMGMALVFHGIIETLQQYKVIAVP